MAVIKLFLSDSLLNMVKVSINLAEIQDWLADVLKQFLVASNQYIGKSSVKWRAHWNTSNLLVHCIVETEFN